MPGTSFDRAAEYYDATRAIPPAVMDKTVAGLTRLLKGRGRVLEIGGGTGRFSRPLQANGVPVVPLDLSRQMLDRGRTQGLRDAVLGDAAALPFHDGAFGAALSVHVLHLVKEVGPVLHEIVRTVHGEYVVVADNWDGFSLNRLYSERAAARTGQRGHLDATRERDLERWVTPKEVIAVAEHTETYDIDEALRLLEARAYSMQWDVPDDVHAEVMVALRGEYSGKRLERSYTVRLLRWDASSLHGLEPRGRAPA